MTYDLLGQKKTEKDVFIRLKNISATELTFNPEEITERFVRGDESRNTEGSGLGLAIVKSFVGLQVEASISKPKQTSSKPKSAGLCREKRQ